MEIAKGLTTEDVKACLRANNGEPCPLLGRDLETETFRCQVIDASHRVLEFIDAQRQSIIWRDNTDEENVRLAIIASAMTHRDLIPQKSCPHKLSDLNPFSLF